MHPASVPLRAHYSNQRLGVIGYWYKSPLLFIEGTGKSGTFKQTDYLSQILEKLQLILEVFAFIHHLLRPVLELLFLKDWNSVHGVSLLETVVPITAQSMELSSCLIFPKVLI